MDDLDAGSHRLGDEVDQAERLGASRFAIQLPLRVAPQRTRLREAFFVGQAVEKGGDGIDARGVIQGEVAQAEGAVHGRAGKIARNGCREERPMLSAKTMPTARTTKLTLRPIGFVRSPFVDRVSTPRQPSAARGV